MPDLLGAAIAIRGMAGDQQAATIGQACFAPGMMKSTYGTGCFALLNTGDDAGAPRKNRLLTTIAYQLDGKRTYALEGSIFVAGAAVQWLRDGLGIIEAAGETGRAGRAADPASRSISCRPSSASARPIGMPSARGALFGLTRGTGPQRSSPGRRWKPSATRRATCSTPCAATGRDARRRDGAAGRWRHGRLGLDHAVPRRHSRCAGRPAEVMETTALGAAYLAGLAAGLLPDAGGVRQKLGARTPLQARHGRRNARENTPAGTTRCGAR